MQEGKRITTIEGLERDGELHSVQAAFIEHDGFQHGFCTSGQIMSASAVSEEAKAGWPSAASVDPVTLRLMNDTETDPHSGRPFSMRAMRKCLLEGAARFGGTSEDRSRARCAKAAI
jgi:hypothetical protein